VALTHLLDTDICIEAIRRRSQPLLQRLREHSALDVAISTITEAELTFGALNSSASARNEASVETFLSPFTILPFDRACIPAYARLRLQLERAGARIEAMDQLIAAQAVTFGLVMVTNNVGEFRRVPGLRVEKWLA
jgi:tRNA(fMet)-specific endonuclease VapC